MRNLAAAPATLNIPESAWPLNLTPHDPKPHDPTTRAFLCRSSGDPAAGLAPVSGFVVGGAETCLRGESTELWEMAGCHEIRLTNNV